MVTCCYTFKTISWRKWGCLQTPVFGGVLLLYIKSLRFPNNLPSMAVAHLVSKAGTLPSMSKMKAKPSRLSLCSTIQNLCSSICNSSSRRSDFYGALSKRHAFPKALKNLLSDRVGSHLLSPSEFDSIELHSNSFSLFPMVTTRKKKFKI